MTTREKLHLLVDELTDAEAEAALTRLAGERGSVNAAESKYAFGHDAGSLPQASGHGAFDAGLEAAS